MPKNKNRSPLIEKLETLCEGLVYISEIDSEVEAFVGEKLSSGSKFEVLAALGTSKSKAEEIEIDKFFSHLTAEQKWFDEAESSQAKRFAKLKNFFDENVEKARVFRFGKTKLEIYVVGVGDDGRLIGVKTEAVET